MKHTEQVRIIREIFECLDNGRPQVAERFTRNDPSVYTSAEIAAREFEMLFQRHPLVVGFSSQIPQPGDFITETLAPVPMLVARQQDGGLRAFINICRHRGACVAQGSGNGVTSFACPYHGWVYDRTGRLAAVPDGFGFDGLDHRSHGLIELAVAEKHGLIWVHPTPEAAIHVDNLLGGLGDDIETYNIGSFVHQETRIVQRRMNWKLVSDTFWEAYHIKVLHASNIGPLFVRNLAMYEPFGLNQRLIGVRKSIEKLRDLPEEKWDLVPHATILMNLFPNTILVMQSDHAEVYRIFPKGVSESTTAVSILAPASSPKWVRAMDLLMGVVEQDFQIGEGIQRNFESGSLTHVNYGRFEQALEHFHSSIRTALAQR